MAMEPPVGGPENAGLESLLGQAAMSHIDLAVRNIRSQVHLIKEEDRALIGRLAAQLQELAPPHGHTVDSFLHDDSQNAVLRHDLEAPSTLSPRKCFVSDVFLAAPSPPEDMNRGRETEPIPDDGKVTDTIEIDGVERLTTTPTYQRLRPSEEFGRRLTTQHWYAQLMDVFDQVDTDKTGAVEMGEWKDALTAAGISLDLALNLFKYVDQDKTGSIDRCEWLHMLESVQEGHCPELITQFSEALGKLQSKNGRIYLAHHRPQYRCLLRVDSPTRMSWDCLMAVLLVYIALMLPYILGFEVPEKVALERLGNAIDVFFMVDVVLNFRTAFYRYEVLIIDSKSIAMNYLSSWFLLDLVTCFPFELLLVGGGTPEFQPAKLMKIIRMLKAFKLLKLTKIKKMLQYSDLMNNLEDRALSSDSQCFLQILWIVSSLCLMCHWLSCFMAASGSGWNLPNESQLSYSTAVYWAMQTLTTVGYGDIYPLAEFERWYATIAMVLGGAFYGFMIGMISSTVATRDRNAAAYGERMSEVQAWLCHHTELPKILRWRIKRYFQHHLTQRAAVEDIAIINDLSPALIQDVSFFFIPEQVRCNLLFHDLPNSALAHLMPILEKRESDVHDYIVSMGDPGTKMFIIMDGKARFEEGHQWTARDSAELEEGNFDTQVPNKKDEIICGDSFGEEILLGLEEAYHYTVVTVSRMEMYSISVAPFEQAFTHMPDLVHRMHTNFVRNSMPDTGAGKHGRSSVTRLGPGGFPQGFPDVVLDSLQDIKHFCATTGTKLHSLTEPIDSKSDSMTLGGHPVGSPAQHTQMGDSGCNPTRSTEAVELVLL